METHTGHQSQHKQHFEFNEEQILVITLQIWPSEQAWRAHLKGKADSHATVDTLRKLPNDLGSRGGGCGKTTIMQLVIVPILETFFSRVVLTAPSNRAARRLGPRAKNMHSIACMRPPDSMRTSSLHIKTDHMRKRLDANQTQVGGWIHDEVLQTASTVLHAASLRSTYARQHTYKLNTAR